ncbi:MAG: hypothetical protein IPJ32_12665 [Sphingobacteriaceae bacterium]|nr:hypothetical protein [Sphingobacteriaceae bacterium]
MRALILLFIAITLFSCGRRHDPNETKLNLEYLDKEINERTLVLSKDTSFSSELNTIRKEVDNLKWLTVDIENINASIVKSNQYFTEASKKYNVDTAGFIILYKGVPLQDIVNFIKKNHLNLLNKIIIERNKNGDLMYTAQ